MAAPVASSIILPDDSGNTGKLVRTETKVVGGSTVHEHFFVPSPAMTITGRYLYSSTQQTVSATVQNGTTTGFLWLALPAAATVTARIRRIKGQVNASSALATPTAPVISCSKATFTGTASGATAAAVPYQTAGAANQMIVRTAVTGMTPTIVADFCHLYVPSAETGVGILFAEVEMLPYNPMAWYRGEALEIAPGELVAIWQSVAGTSADTRKFGLMVEWDELDLS